MSRLHALAARLSLRARLAVLAGLGAAVVLLVGALVLYHHLSGELDAAVTAELRVRAEDAAAEVEAGIAPVPGHDTVTQVYGADATLLRPEGGDPLLSTPEVEAASGGETVVDRSVPGLADHARTLALPAVAASGDELVIAVAGSTAPIERGREQLLLVLGVVGPLLVLAVSATAWLLTAAALRPVRRMTEGAERMSLSSDDVRLPQPPGRDEIAQLGRTLNRMLVRTRASVERERAFIDDASHDLRTPIAVLRGELELARLTISAEPDATAAVEAIDSAIEETDRLARVADHLLALARAEQHSDRDQAPGAVSPLRHATERAVDRLPAADVRISVTGREVLARIDPDLVDRMLTNLLTNAIRVATDRVRVSVRAGALAILVVADDGPGFEPALLQHALERFARSPETADESGAGLGLSIVSSIASAAGGHVRLRNDGPLGGAAVEVRLPLADPD